jgi:hypothetical protein
MANYITIHVNTDHLSGKPQAPCKKETTTEADKHSRFLIWDMILSYKLQGM